LFHRSTIDVDCRWFRHRWLLSRLLRWLLHDRRLGDWLLRDWRLGDWRLGDWRLGDWLLQRRRLAGLLVHGQLCCWLLCHRLLNHVRRGGGVRSDGLLLKNWLRRHERLTRRRLQWLGRGGLLNNRSVGLRWLQNGVERLRRRVSRSSRQYSEGEKFEIRNIGEFKSTGKRSFAGDGHHD
jgi:hypothetical protein